jgi:hypothetical protein
VNAPSIAIVVTFFGAAPAWFPAFLLSCRRNPDVQWVLYADFDPAISLPANVTVRRIDLDELNERASDAVGARIRVERAGLRKVCDFKPLYGRMFADGLRGFDWWACSDLDIIWGDIRRFVTADILERHDIVSSRRHKLSGHFTLYRNVDPINRTFEMAPDVVTLLTAPTYRRLDEDVLTHRLLERTGPGVTGDAPRVHWEAELTINSTYQKALPPGDAGNLFWLDGRTFDAGRREFMYLHFHKLKDSMRTFDVPYDEAPRMLVINRDGIFAQRQTDLAVSRS